MLWRQPAQAAIPGRTDARPGPAREERPQRQRHGQEAEEHERDAEGRNGAALRGPAREHQTAAHGELLAELLTSQLLRHRVEQLQEHRRKQPEEDAGRHENALSEQHGQRCFVRVPGVVAARLPQKGDAKRLHEARRRQRARQRQHGAAQGEHEPDEARRRAEPLQQRLVGEPFADEPVEGRERGNGRRADEEEQSRPAHSLRQPAHFLHVARVRRVQHRARAEEEQRLERSVIDGVIQPGDQRQRGQRGMAGMQEHQRGAQAHENDADVFDAVIGQQTLEVVFH